ncbi:LON peptidase substrate-binding domain-containing protein, partial [Aureimonas leprariae]
MVVAGNVNYRSGSDLPAEVPIFPLEGALLLPAGQMPLNIFEPRYIAMIDEALRRDRIIGMIQPRFDGTLEADGEPTLCNVGCLGRITSLSETGDGRYIVNLHGVARFRVEKETTLSSVPYRCCRIGAFLGDLVSGSGVDLVDRE